MIKEGLFNYFSQKYLKIKKVCWILVFFLIISLYLNAADIFSDQNLFYYAFSTIVQGFLALVSLLGAVVIYKLQMSENSLNSINESLRIPARYFRGGDVDGYSVEDMRKLGEEVLKRPQKEYEANRIIKGCEDMQKVREEKNEIRSKMVDFSLLSFINVGMALIGMIVSRLCLINDLYLCPGIYLIVNISLSYLSMIYAFKVIRKILGYDFHINLTN